MNKLASTLHDATHLVPGVPPHTDFPAANRPHRAHVNPSPRDQNPRHDAPPRVLVEWQGWIGRLVGRNGNREVG